jgi:predicted dehydrogenase
MGLKVGMVGVGSFAQSFIPLFKAHPLVDAVVLCDTNAEKLAENAQKHGIEKTLPSLDALCNSDLDAAVIITQNWLHGPQAVQALRAGKHVYSAVPAGNVVDEIRELVRAVEETGKVYMVGETSYYYPGAIYCRQRLAEGAFGHIVYAEGEYYHDWDHGLYEVMKWRGGERWREFAGGPPMHYPTHSVGQVLSVVGGHLTHVSCQGFVDTDEDGIYDPTVNRWQNVFSNQSALFKMSNGGMCRINEFRRIGHPGTERMSLYGTEGCFEDSGAGKVWVTKDRAATIRLDDLLRCQKAIPTTEEANRQGMGILSASDAHFFSVSAVHDSARLPREFAGLTNGHQGSHQFLVDDFVKGCLAQNQTLPNNVWEAARAVLPGLIAHESACRGGELLEVPDFGGGA